ncbi:MAG: hypothetical protein J1E61_04800 [Lachnospiraceae bacterium]|nr:hypothetical protein [Lachnospiraceae bacterium]
MKKSVNLFIFISIFLLFCGCTASKETPSGKSEMAVFDEEPSLSSDMIVEDHTFPEITLKRDIPVLHPYDSIHCRELVEEITAENSVYLCFADGWGEIFSPTEPGIYELEIVAEDMYYYHETKAKVTLTVEPLETVPDPETAMAIQNDDALSLAFQDYLLGTGTAVIGKTVDFESLYHTFPTFPAVGDSVSLNDISQMINNEERSNPYHLTNIRYALLDCGMDGKPELALQYVFELNPHSFTRMLTMILQEQNDKLVITYVLDNDSNERYAFTTLYQDGLYIRGAQDSDRAITAYHYRFGFFDRSGNLVDVYDRNMSLGDSGLPYVDPDLKAILTYFSYDDASQITDDDRKTIEDLIGNLKVDEYIIGTDTYLSCYPKSNPDSPNRQSLSYYLSLCEKAGTRFYSNEEIDRSIAGHASALGFSDRKPVNDRTPEDEVAWQLLLGSGYHQK